MKLYESCFYIRFTIEYTLLYNMHRLLDITIITVISEIRISF